MNNIRNTRINRIAPLLSPEMLRHKLPSNDSIDKHVDEARLAIENILNAKDNRLLVIVGPCSIHDPSAAIEYAKKLQEIALELHEQLYIVMRVYFEKPRTNIGWKGLINDPHLDDSLAINDGLLLARELLLELNTIGVAVATEFVDTLTPQYISDLVSWAAIGARTTESQPHRTLSSGLSMTVGFKNNTAGDISAAVNAVLAAKNPHRFLSVTEQGLAAIVDTNGNDSCHIVLRGGISGPNYDEKSVHKALALLEAKDLPGKIMIDCSHENSGKDYKKQAKVIDSICQQLKICPDHIIGLMLESNLHEGKQELKSGVKLNYGQSITDGCVGWAETESLLHKLADTVNRSEKK